MTLLLSLDPGKSTGAALAYYDATTPYRLLQRWNILGGVEGFVKWWHDECPEFDELVVEKFILDGSNKFTADLTPREIEGALVALLWGTGVTPAYQLRSAKGDLISYPPEAKTKTQRQRVRFNYLDRFGLFAKGAHNDDSNDAITHGLVALKKARHAPTVRAYFPPRAA